MKIYFDELEKINISNNKNFNYITTNKLLEFLNLYLNTINDNKNLKCNVINYQNKYVNEISCKFLKFVLKHKFNRNQLRSLLKRYIRLLKNKLKDINSNTKINEVKIITRSVSKLL